MNTEQTKSQASLKNLTEFVEYYYGIDYSELAMGTRDDSIKGLIMKNSRMDSIVANSDLPELGRIIVVGHEVGHYVLKHLEGVKISRLFDNNFGYCQSSTQTARMENEANFYVADIYLDDEETLDIISTADLLSAASALNVPIEILDFKLRLLHHEKRLENYREIISVRSDCLKGMHIARSAFDYY